jgi:hypothetical protein
VTEPATARLGKLAAVGCATLVAAGAGIALGTTLSSEPPAHVAPAERRVVLKSGVALLPLPQGWKPLGRRAWLPGFHEATAVRGADADVALDIRPPEDASLLPSAVVASAGAAPEPELLRVAGRTAWGYELPRPAPDKRLVALSLPTTGGVVTIACQAADPAMDGVATECARALGAVRLDGARALPPAPETAAGMVLPQVVDALNRQRRSWRRALAGTRSPGGRDAAARHLADAYDDAQGRLRPLAAGDALRLTAQLSELARAHRTLAAASLRRDAPAALRAGSAIGAGERALGPLLRAVSGVQRTERSAG